MCRALAIKQDAGNQKPRYHEEELYACPAGVIKHFAQLHDESVRLPLSGKTHVVHEYHHNREPAQTIQRRQISLRDWWQTSERGCRITGLRCLNRRSKGGRREEYRFAEHIDPIVTMGSDCKQVALVQERGEPARPEL